MKVKPIWIQDDFMGDFDLCCPKCKEIITSPLKAGPPAKCSNCGTELDWSDFNKKKECAK